MRRARGAAGNPRARLEPTRPGSAPLRLVLVLVMVLGAAPGASVDVVFTGDVIPHQTVKETAKSHVRVGADGSSLNHDGWDHVFGPLTEAFRRADVAVVNLETPLTTL